MLQHLQEEILIIYIEIIMGFAVHRELTTLEKLLFTLGH